MFNNKVRTYIKDQNSTALNNIMLRYAQYGNYRAVADCIAKGADANYDAKGGVAPLLVIGLACGYWKLIELAAKNGATFDQNFVNLLSEKLPERKRRLAFKLQEILNARLAI